MVSFRMAGGYISLTYKRKRNNLEKQFIVSKPTLEFLRNLVSDTGTQYKMNFQRKLTRNEN